ncbi:M23 family metallopeptidase [Agromyces sp. NPDC049794]|uniref:M23 family metallopeptidase n=1 Tax=unclassified Agromyces TaxID=2639701 RepID=UPI0033D8F085
MATVTAVALFGFCGVSPAYAEEVVPTDPALSSETPSPEPTAPAPTEEPAPTPTEEPAPTEEPPPPTEEPPPPTEEPPPPTEEPPPTEPPPTEVPPTEPPPTEPPPATGEPTPPPASVPPATGAPLPSAPLTFSGDGPVVRATTSTTTPTVESAAIVSARAKLDRALATLREAEATLADARSTREAARAVAGVLQEAADEAQLRADAAGRVYFAAAQGDGTTISSMDAVFGAGNDLLAGLGGVARVAQVHGDAAKLLEIAEARAKDADAAQERADAALAAVDAVPVEALESEVAAAERAVAEARRALDDAQSQASDQSRLASSSSTALIASLPTDAGQLSDQGWALPVAGRLTDGFGPRPNKPVAGVNDFHRGTDLSASCGAPIFAATSGTVVQAARNGTYGNWVLIDHGSNVATGYAHLIDGGIAVSPGESVAAGQLIGAVGSTGASTGCHLHFEVRLGGIAVDAIPFMAARGITLG